MSQVEEPSADDEQEALRDIEAIKQMRLVPRTQQSYRSKNTVFRRYLRDHFPDMITDGEIDLDSLTLEAFQSFIVMKQRDDKLSFSACSVPRPS
jgi:hypothetical protein